ncbi:DNA-binding transcriptional regulator, HxlR family [Mucilaginibacter gossypiicola]|uniref:DNA-binding transcriptional regulator, HxlR family n=1 Tax=Mucilaginibacter gossypiicola TaxID=551995 RepID=A0A1H8P548_9SPHI|nr:helix-turn-helix domain-containing protein [Mucilaginibacter gossypiicola]SEO36633.1 DNA-binding transcriptional regulator, HxlR family [Mucilaginibacter gossypiicola]
MDHKNIPHSKEACKASVNAVRDALYVVNGKWKLPMLVSLINGPKRFKELQRDLEDITPKVLSKELRDLELNGFVTRTVYDTTPVTVIYERTDYANSLSKVISELHDWGMKHREHIKQMSRAEAEARKAVAV